MKKKIFIFAGYTISIKESEKATGVSVAGNKMQLEIIKELSKYEDMIILPISIYPCNFYPKDDKVLYFRKEVRITDNLNSIRIGFINLPLIKQIIQIVNMYREMNKVSKKFDDVAILAFNMYPQIGIPSIRIKKNRNANVTVIFADPPIDCLKNRNVISRFLRNIFYKNTINNLAAVDKVIALNKEAVKRFAVDKRNIIVEGGISDKEVNKYENVPYKERKEIIIFSGSLVGYNGIVNLVKAMKLVKSSVTLEVYGDGPLKSYVMEAAEKNNNIRYCGYINNLQMMEAQRHAYILLNPRPVEDLIAQVTFPSKLFEYLTSGTVVISTKLNGLGEEYKDKMYFFDSTTPEDIAEKVNCVMNKSFVELDQMALLAKEFILKEKTWKSQARKIHDFLLTE